MPRIISFPDIPGKEFEVGDDFTESDIEELYSEERPSSSTFRRVVGDTAVSLAKGVVGFPQSIAGLADIVGGMTGAGSFSKAIEPLVDFKATQDILGGLYSPDAKRAQRRVAAAEGVVDTLKTVLKNPSMIQQVAGESLPSMLGGAAGAGRLAATGLVGRGLAAGIGEGAITAGQQAAEIREQTATGELSPEQAKIAAVSGLLTGAVGTFGNKIAGKLGIDDIDLITSPSVSGEVKRSIMARAVGGAIIEAGEETLQSTQEQIAANIASGKPWNEGLEQAGVLGGIVGGLMGGVAGMRPSSAQQPETGELTAADIADTEAALAEETQETPLPFVEPSALAPVQPPSLLEKTPERLELEQADADLEAVLSEPEIAPQPPVAEPATQGGGTECPPPLLFQVSCHLQNVHWLRRKPHYRPLFLKRLRRRNHWRDSLTRRRRRYLNPQQKGLKMPFKSKSMMRACWAKHDKNWDCNEWSRKTKNKQSLPKHSRKKR